MATVAVLGMGRLGTGFAQGLRRQGHTVRVWNRTPSRCADAIAAGAQRFDTPAEAVRGAERVHLVLHADAAVDAVVLQLREGLGADVPVLDHTTCLPASVAIRAPLLRSQGVRYLHAPVFMGPDAAREAQGVMLLAGPADDHAALREALEPMTGRLLYVGAAPDKAAKLKLIGNGGLISLLGVMGDLFHLGRQTGLDDRDVLGLFEAFTPTPHRMGARALGSTDGRVTFAMTTAHKDLTLMLQSVDDPAVLRVLPALAQAMEAHIGAGGGDDDYTRIGHPDTLR